MAKNNFAGLKAKRWICPQRPVRVRSSCWADYPWSALHCLHSQLAQLKVLKFRVECLCLVFLETGRQICHCWNIILARPKLKSTCVNNLVEQSVLLRPVERTRPCFMLFALRRPVMRETTSEGNRSCLRAGRQIWSECRACDVVCENQRTSVWVCVCVGGCRQADLESCLMGIVI